MSRIDHLRGLIAKVGEEQLRYYKFFPPFTDKLERELGEYLGAPECVALSNTEKHFSRSISAVIAKPAWDSKMGNSAFH